MKTKTILKIVAICVICAATTMSGCMEPDSPASGQSYNVPGVTYSDDGIIYDTPTCPTIPAATPTPIEPIYSTIWGTGSITLVSYSYDGEYLDYVNMPFSDEMPYTEYDWNEDTPVQEFVDIVFLGVPYNSIDIGYGTTERPATDKVVNRGECTIYFDDVYVVMSWWCTGTRY